MSPSAPDRPVRVLVVDDDDVVRYGLRMMLDGANALSVVGEAADGADVPDAVAAHHPDVVLMDLRMPRVDGVTATRRLRRSPQAPEVLVLTTFDDDTDVFAALRVGAAGYLLKDSPPVRIVEAIHRVASGEPALSPRVMRALMDRAVRDTGTREDSARAFDVLTTKEREVALAVAGGASNADVAARLHLSLATVKTHVSRTLTKLELTNRTQIALLAHEAGLLEPPTDG